MFEGRFRCTSGYIVCKSEDSNKLILSPHVDLILVDNLVPNAIFPQREFKGELEYIPREAVVGVFEIKKILNEKSVKEAFEQIKKIREAMQFGLKDFSRHYSLGGNPSPLVLTRIIKGDTRSRDSSPRPFFSRDQTGIYANPLIGIIGLAHEYKKGPEKNPEKYKDKKYEEKDYKILVTSDYKLVDIIFSFDGFLQGIRYDFYHYENDGNLHRESGCDFCNKYEYHDKSIDNVKIALSYMSNFLYKATGTIFDWEDYY